jgi:hypothetical protein
MSEEKLGNLLRSLPREKASVEFTDRVMSRVEEGRRPIVFQPRFALAVSIVLIVAAWVGADRWLAMQQEEQTNERIHTLKSEIEKIQGDIRLLRDLAPVLYLGGNEDVDFVLDLGKAAREKGDGIKPISFDGSDQKGDSERW